MTTKKKTGTAPEQAAPKPATVAAATPTSPALPAKPERPAPIMSQDHIPQTDPGIRTPARPGPRTGMSSMSDGDYISAFGDKAELLELRTKIEQRRAEGPRWIWQRCDHCGLVMRVPEGSPEGDFCPKNWLRRKDLGKMYRMADDAVKVHLEAEARKDREADERIERAALYNRNVERGKAGLPALSMEEFRKLRKAERRDRAEQDKQQSEIASLYRPGARKK